MTSMQKTLFPRLVKAVVHWLCGGVILLLFACQVAPSWGQQAASESAGKVAYAIDVPLPLRSDSAKRLLDQLEQIQGSVDATSQQRQIVVLTFGPDSDGRGSRFEDCLAVARFLSGKGARSLRTIAFLRGPVRGHAVLPVISCDEFLVLPEASLGATTSDGEEVDPALLAVYQSIAAGRGLLNPQVVTAMLDPSAELYQVSQVDGSSQFVGAEQLAELRADGAAWREEKLVGSDRTAEFSATQLRNFRWASHLLESPDELTEALGVERVVSQATVENTALVARRIDLFGSISAQRIRRIQANIAAAVDDAEVNTILLAMDSSGGSLESSLQLGLTLSRRDGGIQKSIGFVESEARGDSALIALACRPLYLHPEARLGGAGGEAIDHEQVLDLTVAIAELAERTGRPVGLLQGLLDRESRVYRFRHKRTGQVAYFAEDADEASDAQTWDREEAVELSGGISAADAVELGLAEGLASSLEEVALSGGLERIPDTVSDRAIVHTVEWLGNLPWLSTLLIFIGFMALSMEVSAPGLSVPGFVALLCFILFFWMKFLSGTAEWLEILLFVGGVFCILLEVLVIPGLGVFGIGGLIMVVSAIVLTSQTFVIPQNEYQYQRLTGGLLTVIVAFLGVIGGVLGLRYMLPGTPLFRHLVMPGGSSEEMHQQEQRERLVHYDWLAGQEGVSLTPLMPAGKARFSDEVVAVVSDGSPISVGAKVRVVEVRGNRIVVEEIVVEELE